MIPLLHLIPETTLGDKHVFSVMNEENDTQRFKWVRSVWNSEEHTAAFVPYNQDRNMEDKLQHFCLCVWSFTSLFKTEETVGKMKRVALKEITRKGNIWNLVIPDS